MIKTQDHHLSTLRIKQIEILNGIKLHQFKQIHETKLINSQQQSKTKSYLISVIELIVHESSNNTCFPDGLIS